MSVESNAQTAKLTPLKTPCFEQMETLIETFPEHPFETLVLTTADLERFSCSQCGVCCALPWRIHLSQSYYERWYTHFHDNPSGRFQRRFCQLEGPLLAILPICAGRTTAIAVFS